MRHLFGGVRIWRWIRRRRRFCWRNLGGWGDGVLFPAKQSRHFTQDQKKENINAPFLPNPKNLATFCTFGGNDMFYTQHSQFRDLLPKILHFPHNFRSFCQNPWDLSPKFSGLAGRCRAFDNLKPKRIIFNNGPKCVPKNEMVNGKSPPPKNWVVIPSTELKEIDIQNFFPQTLIGVSLLKKDKKAKAHRHLAWPPIPQGGGFSRRCFRCFRVPRRLSGKQQEETTPLPPWTCFPNEQRVPIPPCAQSTQTLKRKSVPEVKIWLPKNGQNWLLAYFVWSSHAQNSKRTAVKGGIEMCEFQKCAKKSQNFLGDCPKPATWDSKTKIILKWVIFFWQKYPKYIKKFQNIF